MKLNWKQEFIRYDERRSLFIYSDINASYCSVHQFLENGMGRPCVVANGNVAGKADAGSCIAISYEARSLGIRRGASLMEAKAAAKELVVYESCLPLYELFADLFDMVLEKVIPSSTFYRGSCDEIAVEFNQKKFYVRPFWKVVNATVSFISNELGHEVSLNIREDQVEWIESLPLWQQHVFAICYLIRDVIKKVLGVPLSLSVAPSISLCKALVDFAKPRIRHGQRYYDTDHDAICYPLTRNDANQLLRQVELKDLCGIQKIARRFHDVGIDTVAQFQDYVTLERSISISKNLHLGKVVWYMCHGRDDVLSGYLAGIRDRR